jgi:hypothetical protein
MKRTQPGPRPVVRLSVARGKPEGKSIPVPGPLFTIGRDESCQLRPHTELISRRHAELRVTADGVLLRDLGSRNGTLVNGKAVTAPTALRDGDLLEVGPLAFTVSIQGAPPAVPESDADIVAWLIADEDSPIPDGPSDISTGPTRAAETPAEEPPPPRPAARPRPESRDSSAAAGDLLRAMTGQRRPVKR